MIEETDVMEEIAIIGMAGRFPGAKNVTQFWENLANGVESISRFSDEELLNRGVSQDQIDNPNYVNAGTIIQNADMFDASFFGYSQHDAEIMDPQQRIFLEIAWEALESAGYTSDSYEGSIGVFAGTSGNDYRKQLPANYKSITSGIDSFELMMGNEPDFLTTRVSYKLNLKGPSLTIQTACSTSLVAVHQACQHLLTYQCDMALSGGVCIRFPQGQGYLYQEGMIGSSDGRCRPFDAKANGTLFGNGAGIVLLKRLSESIEDNDTILAVIKGSAVNNDGSMKVGFTAPSVNGQAEVISTALAMGEVKADSISYIEAHGTGTPLGDPIEVEALTQAYREHTAQNQFCAIGSVKSNIGHLDAAAGITGLIKTVLALQNKKIPPTLHYTTPNPNIDFSNTPFYVNNSLQEWERNDQPLRAGVSSFGIGGTNAHVVLEEAPNIEKTKDLNKWHLLPFSAKTDTALDKQLQNFFNFIHTNPDEIVTNIAYTLQLGRKHFKYRKALACKTLKDISIKDDSAAQTSEKKDIIFMFSGQDSQYINMCFDLYQEFPFFKKTIDQCAKILKPHLKLDIREILYPSDSENKKADELIAQTYITQPVLFTIEYALAKLWNHFGISPAALIGHSIGEYTAACLAGVFSLEDALKIVTARGRLMQSLPAGSMLVIPLSVEDIQPYLTSEITLAVHNSSSTTVVSGKTDPINSLSQRLAKNGIDTRVLSTSHAFHSPMMDPILNKFEKEIEKINLQSPQISFVSNLTGTWITKDQATKVSYWSEHLRRPVQFYSCADTLLKEYPNAIFLEVGPGQALTLLTKQHPATTQEQKILPSTRRPVQKKNDVSFFLNTLCKIWESGINVFWEKFHSNGKAHFIPLPTYPFEPKRYWVETDYSKLNIAKETHAAPTQQPMQPNKISKNRSQEKERSLTKTERMLIKIWLKLLPGIIQVTLDDSFFDLGGNSFQAAQMVAKINKKTGVDLSLSTLIDNHELKKLAKKIESNLVPTSSYQNQWRSLVALQPKGSKPPLFLVHAIGNNVLNYKVFIPHLGEDRPLYGLQAQGLDGLTPPFKDMQTMAAHYIQEIKTIQPHGPYYLGGGSFGGMVALEMAQQLLKEREHIAFIAMFDTEGPNYWPDDSLKNSDSLLLYYLKKIFRNSLQTSISKIYNKLIYIGRIILQKQLVSVYKFLKHPIPHSLRYQYLERVNQNIWEKYIPQKYNGRLYVFSAYNENNKKGYTPNHSWENVLFNFNVIEIPGCHETFIEEFEVGKKLKTLLLQTQNEAI